MSLDINMITVSLIFIISMYLVDTLIEEPLQSAVQYFKCLRCLGKREYGISYHKYVSYRGFK